MAQRFPANISRTETFIIRKGNFQNRDTVMLKAKTHRNYWPVASIIETFADKYGVARTVRLKIESEKKR